jgi:small subunit ribosomal protein S7
VIKMTEIENNKILAFNRWDTSQIKVEDPGLKNYITLRPRVVVKTGGTYAKNRFHKSRIFIVERLINKLMVCGHKGKKHLISSGHNTGKSQKVYNIVENCLENIENKTKENPIKVFVKALENAAPREEVVSIEYGGARYPKAVECAPQRRIDITLKIMVQSACQKAFNSKRKIVDTLSDEIINAYNMSPNSTAISKKNELERQADSAR